MKFLMSTFLKTRIPRLRSMAVSTSTVFTIGTLSLFGIGALFGLEIVSPAFAGETMYIQSANAGLKKEPKMSADNIAELHRGDEVAILKKDGMWFEVSATGKTGWVSKLFMSPNKPVGASSLVNEVKSEFKANRERTQPKAVAASTRGLDSSRSMSRVREGRQLFQMDYPSLEVIEGMKIENEELNQFQKSGKLPAN